METFRNTTFESLLTLTVQVDLNGEIQKEAFEYDRTEATTIAEIKSFIAIHYGVPQSAIQIRFPGTDQPYGGLVQENTPISDIFDTSHIFAIIHK